LIKVNHIDEIEETFALLQEFALKFKGRSALRTVGLQVQSTSWEVESIIEIVQGRLILRQVQKGLSLR